MSMVPKK